MRTFPAMEIPGLPRALAGGVLFLVLCGVAGRLVYQRSAFSRDPLQAGNILDTAAYQADAAAMLRGGPFEPALSTRPPGYPWFLAGVEGLGGGTRTVVSLQALLDGLSALLIASLAWKIWRKPLPTLAATAILATSPALIYFSAEVLETSWTVFWVALHLRILAACLDSRRPRAWAGAGAALGFAALIRPNLLLWAPFLALGAWRRAGCRAAAAVCAGILLLIAPVILKNRIQGGEWTLIAPSGGINLWLGNVPDPEIHGPIPYYAHLPGPVSGTLWNRLQQRAEKAGATTLVQKDRWFAHQALSKMAQHPRRSAELLAAKLAAFLNAFPLSNNRDLLRPGSPFRAALLFPASWGFLLPLAILGMAGLLRRKHAPIRWLGLFAASFSLSVVLFFVSS
ncbi:MAG: glycosyltransferase family 39 protein, partial [Planctomycetota bacterium]